MYTRLYSFLESKKIFFDSQYGFRSKRSCEQVIMELIVYVLQSKNCNEQGASAYLDLSKAFNMLNHTILLKKLECYRVRGMATSWFEDYLRGRNLIAKITMSPNHTVKSDRFNITFGTAQGSCLSPLLFIFFVSDVHLLPQFSKIILFADDTTIFNSHKSTKYLRFMLEDDLLTSHGKLV